MRTPLTNHQLGHDRSWIHDDHGENEQPVLVVPLVCPHFEKDITCFTHVLLVNIMSLIYIDLLSILTCMVSFIMEVLGCSDAQDDGAEEVEGHEQTHLPIGAEDHSHCSCE
jgi:hypothetical protein